MSASLTQNDGVTALEVMTYIDIIEKIIEWVRIARLMQTSFSMIVLELSNLYHKESALALK